MKLRKLLGVLMALLMVVTVLPTALAAPGDTRAAVSYVDENGEPQACEDYTSASAELEEWSGWIVVTEDTTMGDVEWDDAYNICHRVEVTDDVFLILTDGTTLTIPSGIHIPEGSSLTVYAQEGGSGKLIVGVEDNPIYNGVAGIGGNDNETGGTVTINGGDISVIGGDMGAGIGGGLGGNAELVTINGGKVFAQGSGDCGDGIGTGDSANDGTNIVINGGTVTAVGGGSGAGIGCVHDSTVTINGGTVTATGGTSDGGVGAAGIGGNYVNMKPGTIIINGGTVTAKGGDGTNANRAGAGIGGASGGFGGSITISGGIVNATGGLNGGSGIGPGAISFAFPGDFGTVSITGGQVSASSANASGIGYSGTFTPNGGDPIPLNTVINLGWTNETDFILSSGYAGTVTLSKDFAVDGSDETFEAGTVDDNSNLANKKLIPPQETPTGYHIIVDDKTAGNATVAGIDAEALYSGEVTFTVSCDDACLVAIVNDDGTYTVLTCATTDDEHSFTVTVTNADVTIVIAIKGDANLNGAREAKDATFAAQAAAGKRTFSALQQLAMDGNGDGVFDSKDATYAAQVESGKKSYKW
ncbi:MAG: hypothetical protein II458_01345 [Oscillospiraceae bacterium]|nr:hypothetical protein [Oscillospiraceae bacterium]